jgi:hypothetical protein
MIKMINVSRVSFVAHPPLFLSGIGKTSMRYYGIHYNMIVADRKFGYPGSYDIQTASFIMLRMVFI